MRIHDFEGIVGLVTVAHHAEGVGNPESTEVDGTIAAYPSPVSGQIVVIHHVHVLHHPLHALSVVIVPSAVTTALLGPQVDHLTSEIGRVCNNTTASEAENHVDKLAVLVAEVLVQPEEEELVFVECVEGAERGPEEELVHGEREAASEQVGGALFEGDAEQSLRGAGVVAAQLLRPRLIGVVSATSVLERHDQRAGRQESHDRANEVLVRVVVSVLLRRPSTTIDVLPEGELDG